MNLRTEAKLKYLVRLLNLRVKLMSQVDRVAIDVINDMISVTWYAKPGLNKKLSQFESIEFPVAHLGRRIEHYRRKVRNEFKNRHK